MHLGLQFHLSRQRSAVDCKTYSCQPGGNLELPSPCRGYIQTLDVNAGTRFNAYTLPYPGILDVPILFAVRYFVVHHFRKEGAILRFIHRGIYHPNHELVLSRTNRTGNFDCERRIPTLVGSHRNSIEENFTKIINSAELEKHMASVPKRGQVEVHPIPGCAHVISEVIELSIPGEPDSNAAPA